MFSLPGPQRGKLTIRSSFSSGDRGERSGQTHREYRSLRFPAPSEWRRSRSDGAPPVRGSFSEGGSVGAGYAGATRRCEVARYALLRFRVASLQHEHEHVREHGKESRRGGNGVLHSGAVENEITRDDIESFVHGHHGSPFTWLGPHQTESLEGRAGWVVRTYCPGAEKVEIRLDDGETVAMERLHDEGFFQARLYRFSSETPRYRYICYFPLGYTEERRDPYAYRHLLTDLDLYLLGEGTHFHSYRRLGAHLDSHDGVDGTRFAVWAPNARSICVIGDFNNWDRRLHPMQIHHSTGIWQVFLPDVGVGANYKYLMTFQSGQQQEKIDPYGFYFEEPPKTAAIIYDLGKFQWDDQEWMKRRQETDPLKAPLSIYEAHLGSWKRAPGDRPLSYRELADQMVPYLKRMGFTHIELLPITEHPFTGSWGYQTTGYFAPTSRYGEPDDFRHFVQTCHQNGIGVLLDWVPAHFPRDIHALATFDGTHLYEHADPRMGAHPDWGTLIFNYSRNEVRNFLLSSALFWLAEYHLDGLRVDAVASMLYLDYSRKQGEWLPNKYGGRENLGAIDFLRRFNEVVYEYHPGAITMAEESTAWPSVSRPTYLGGLGFTMKWNMGWMHDSLAYMSMDPVFRKFHQNKLTFSMLYAFSENYILPLSHDEVVHGKRSLLDKQPGDLWQKFANMRAFLAYMFGHPGKKLIFMGSEFGQWLEWKWASSLDWHLLEEGQPFYDKHQKLQDYVRELNLLYRAEPSLYEVDYDWTGFDWIDLHDAEQSVISFVRRAQDPEDTLVFVFNFTPVPRYGYRVGVPREGYYSELLNSDSEAWGGGNLGNLGGVHSQPVPTHGRDHSVSLTLPPLAAVILKPVQKPEKAD